MSDSDFPFRNSFTKLCDSAKKKGIEITLPLHVVGSKQTLIIEAKVKKKLVEHEAINGEVDNPVRAAERLHKRMKKDNIIS